MKKRKGRSRRRRIRKLHTAAAWAVVIIAETAVAAMMAAATAKAVLPMAYEERGGKGMGGEWLLIMAVFCGTYVVVHGWIYAAVRKEEKRVAYYNICSHCGSHLDPGERCDCERQAEKIEKRRKGEKDGHSIEGIRRSGTRNGDRAARVG